MGFFLFKQIHIAATFFFLYYCKCFLVVIHSILAFYNILLSSRNLDTNLIKALLKIRNLIPTVVEIGSIFQLIHYDLNISA